MKFSSIETVASALESTSSRRYQAEIVSSILEEVDAHAYDNPDSSSTFTQYLNTSKCISIAAKKLDNENKRRQLAGILLLGLATRLSQTLETEQLEIIRLLNRFISACSAADLEIVREGTLVIVQALKSLERYTMPLDNWISSHLEDRNAHIHRIYAGGLLVTHLYCSVGSGSHQTHPSYHHHNHSTLARDVYEPFLEQLHNVILNIATESYPRISKPFTELTTHLAMAACLDADELFQKAITPFQRLSLSHAILSAAVDAQHQQAQQTQLQQRQPQHTSNHHQFQQRQQGSQRAPKRRFHFIHLEPHVTTFILETLGRGWEEGLYCDNIDDHWQLQLDFAELIIRAYTTLDGTSLSVILSHCSKLQRIESAKVHAAVIRCVTTLLSTLCRRAAAPEQLFSHLKISSLLRWALSALHAASADPDSQSSLLSAYLNLMHNVTTNWPTSPAAEHLRLLWTPQLHARVFQLCPITPDVCNALQLFNNDARQNLDLLTIDTIDAACFRCISVLLPPSTKKPLPPLAPSPRHLSAEEPTTTGSRASAAAAVSVTALQQPTCAASHNYHHQHQHGNPSQQQSRALPHAPSFSVTDAMAFLRKLSILWGFFPCCPGRNILKYISHHYYSGDNYVRLNAYVTCTFLSKLDVNSGCNCTQRIRGLVLMIENLAFEQLSTVRFVLKRAFSADNMETPEIGEALARLYKTVDTRVRQMLLKRFSPSKVLGPYIIRSLTMGDIAETYKRVLSAENGTWQEQFAQIHHAILSLNNPSPADALVDTLTRLYKQVIAKHYVTQPLVDYDSLNTKLIDLMRHKDGQVRTAALRLLGAFGAIFPFRKEQLVEQRDGSAIDADFRHTLVTHKEMKDVAKNAYMTFDQNHSGKDAGKYAYIRINTLICLARTAELVSQRASYVRIATAMTKLAVASVLTCRVYALQSITLMARHCYKPHMAPLLRLATHLVGCLQGDTRAEPTDLFPAIARFWLEGSSTIDVEIHTAVMDLIKTILQGNSRELHEMVTFLYGHIHTRLAAARKSNDTTIRNQCFAAISTICCVDLGFPDVVYHILQPYVSLSSEKLAEGGSSLSLVSETSLETLGDFIRTGLCRDLSALMFHDIINIAREMLTMKKKRLFPLALERLFDTLMLCPNDDHVVLMHAVIVKNFEQHMARPIFARFQLDTIQGRRRLWNPTHVQTRVRHDHASCSIDIPPITFPKRDPVGLFRNVISSLSRVSPMNDYIEPDDVWAKWLKPLTTSLIEHSNANVFLECSKLASENAYFAKEMFPLAFLFVWFEHPRQVEFGRLVMERVKENMLLCRLFLKFMEEVTLHRTVFQLNDRQVNSPVHWNLDAHNLPLTPFEAGQYALSAHMLSLAQFFFDTSVKESYHGWFRQPDIAIPQTMSLNKTLLNLAAVSYRLSEPFAAKGYEAEWRIIMNQQYSAIAPLPHPDDSFSSASSDAHLSDKTAHHAMGSVDLHSYRSSSSQHRMRRSRRKVAPRTITRSTAHTPAKEAHAARTATASNEDASEQNAHGAPKEQLCDALGDVTGWTGRAALDGTVKREREGEGEGEGEVSASLGGFEVCRANTATYFNNHVSGANEDSESAEDEGSAANEPNRNNDSVGVGAGDDDNDEEKEDDDEEEEDDYDDDSEERSFTDDGGDDDIDDLDDLDDLANLSAEDVMFAQKLMSWRLDDITSAEAQETVDDLLWVENSMKECENHAEVVSLLTQKLRQPDLHPSLRVSLATSAFEALLQETHLNRALSDARRNQITQLCQVLQEDRSSNSLFLRAVGHAIKDEYDEADKLIERCRLITQNDLKDDTLDYMSKYEYYLQVMMLCELEEAIQLKQKHEGSAAQQFKRNVLECWKMRVSSLEYDVNVWRKVFSIRRIATSYGEEPLAATKFGTLCRRSVAHGVCTAERAIRIMRPVLQDLERLRGHPHVAYNVLKQKKFIEIVQNDPQHTVSSKLDHLIASAIQEGVNSLQLSKMYRKKGEWLLQLGHASWPRAIEPLKRSTELMRSNPQPLREFLTLVYALAMKCVSNAHSSSPSSSTPSSSSFLSAASPSASFSQHTNQAGSRRRVRSVMRSRFHSPKQPFNSRSTRNGSFPASHHTRHHHHHHHHHQPPQPPHLSRHPDYLASRTAFTQRHAGLQQHPQSAFSHTQNLRHPNFHHEPLHVHDATPDRHDQQQQQQQQQQHHSVALADSAFDSRVTLQESSDSKLHHTSTGRDLAPPRIHFSSLHPHQPHPPLHVPSSVKQGSGQAFHHSQQRQHLQQHQHQHQQRPPPHSRHLRENQQTYQQQPSDFYETDTDDEYRNEQARRFASFASSYAQAIATACPGITPSHADMTRLVRLTVLASDPLVDASPFLATLDRIPARYFLPVQSIVFSIVVWQNKFESSKSLINLILNLLRHHPHQIVTRLIVAEGAVKDQNRCDTGREKGRHLLLDILRRLNPAITQHIERYRLFCDEIGRSCSSLTKLVMTVCEQVRSKQNSDDMCKPTLFDLSLLVSRIKELLARKDRKRGILPDTHAEDHAILSNIIYLEDFEAALSMAQEMIEAISVFKKEYKLPPPIMEAAHGSAAPTSKSPPAVTTDVARGGHGRKSNPSLASSDQGADSSAVKVAKHKRHSSYRARLYSRLEGSAWYRQLQSQDRTAPQTPTSARDAPSTPVSAVAPIRSASEGRQPSGAHTRTEPDDPMFLFETPKAHRMQAAYMYTKSRMKLSASMSAAVTSPTGSHQRLLGRPRRIHSLTGITTRRTLSFEESGNGRARRGIEVGSRQHERELSSRGEQNGDVFVHKSQDGVDADQSTSLLERRLGTETASQMKHILTEVDPQSRASTRFHPRAAVRSSRLRLTSDSAQTPDASEDGQHGSHQSQQTDYARTRSPTHRRSHSSRGSHSDGSTQSSPLRVCSGRGSATSARQKDARERRASLSSADDEKTPRRRTRSNASGEYLGQGQHINEPHNARANKAQAEKVASFLRSDMGYHRAHDYYGGRGSGDEDDDDDLSSYSGSCSSDSESRELKEKELEKSLARMLGDQGEHHKKNTPTSRTPVSQESRSSSAAEATGNERRLSGTEVSLLATHSSRLETTSPLSNTHHPQERPLNQQQQQDPPHVKQVRQEVEARPSSEGRNNLLRVGSEDGSLGPDSSSSANTGSGVNSRPRSQSQRALGSNTPSTACSHAATATLKYHDGALQIPSTAPHDSSFQSAMTSYTTSEATPHMSSSSPPQNPRRIGAELATALQKHIDMQGRSSKKSPEETAAPIKQPQPQQGGSASTTQQKRRRRRRGGKKGSGRRNARGSQGDRKRIKAAPNRQGGVEPTRAHVGRAHESCADVSTAGDVEDYLQGHALSEQPSLDEDEDVYDDSVPEMDEVLMTMIDRKYEFEEYLSRRWFELESRLNRHRSRQRHTADSERSSQQLISLVQQGDFIMPRDTTEEVFIHGVQVYVRKLGSKQQPRVFQFVGTDGKTYKFLGKAHEDLRQDERVMEIARELDEALKKKVFAHHERLRVETYDVTPLSPNHGLVEWREDFIDYESLILNYNKRVGLSTSRGLPDYYNFVPLTFKHKTFRDYMQKTRVEDFRNALMFRSADAAEFLQRQKNFSQSTAVMSYFGYVLGLGDRHPKNILLHQHTSGVLHVDYGDLFETAQRRLHYPERVFFRMTPTMRMALDIGAEHGLFQRVGSLVLSTLQSNFALIFESLACFKHAPTSQMALPTEEQAYEIPNELFAEFAQIKSWNDVHDFVPHHDVRLSEASVEALDEFERIALDPPSQAITGVINRTFGRTKFMVKALKMLKDKDPDMSFTEGMARVVFEQATDFASLVPSFTGYAALI